MRGIDGNYMNTQADATARLQTAYQAEQNRQQLQAQAASVESLRKLREAVNEAPKKDASGVLKNVGRDGEAGGGSGSPAPGQGQGRGEDNSQESREEETGMKSSHIDIRV